MCCKDPAREDLSVATLISASVLAVTVIAIPVVVNVIIALIGNNVAVINFTDQ